MTHDGMDLCLWGEAPILLTAFRIEDTSVGYFVSVTRKLSCSRMRALSRDRRAFGVMPSSAAAFPKFRRRAKVVSRWRSSSAKRSNRNRSQPPFWCVCSGGSSVGDLLDPALRGAGQIMKMVDRQRVHERGSSTALVNVAVHFEGRKMHLPSIAISQRGRPPQAIPFTSEARPSQKILL